MILYRVTWIHPHEGTCYDWHTKAAAARVAMKQLQAENAGLDAEFRVERESVPCDTAHAKAMCEWLNQRFSRDNG